MSVTNLNPGMVDTRISRTWPWPARAVDRVGMALAGLPAVEVADVVVYLATAPETAGMSGRFYRGTTPARVPAEVYDRALGARLWTISEHLTTDPPAPAP